MGIFSSNDYSTTEHHLSSEDIYRLISPERIPSLTHEQEKLIEEAIRSKRHGDGKISLYQIHEALNSLLHQHLISENDKHGVMQVLKEYFEK